MKRTHLIAIFLLMILVLFLILNRYNLEHFTDTKESGEFEESDNNEIYYDESGNISGIKTKYMGKLDYNNQIVSEFCKNLNQLDDANEHNLLFKDFADKLILKKQKIIESLKDKIQELQKDDVVNDLKKINNFAIYKDDMINKQLEVIKQVENAISSNNNVKLNVM